MLNFEIGESVIYWKRHHQVVIPSIFFRNFSRKKCREYVQHALVFVREPDSDTQHSNTKPNENLNYVFFREKINQCRISLRLFNLERVFLHFQAEKTHRVVSHEYINCGKNYAENTKNHFPLDVMNWKWWFVSLPWSALCSACCFFRLFPWINFRFVQNMPRDCKISWARWQMNFKCFCCLFFLSKNLGRRWRVWHAILVCQKRRIIKFNYRIVESKKKSLRIKL